jgi:hypothetical protein
MRAALPLAVFLAACGQQVADSPTNQAAGQPTGSKPSPALGAKPFTVEEKTELYEFSFSWPAEAAAVPELVTRFRAEMAQSRTDIASGADEDAAMRKQQGSDFNPFMASTAYETAGQTPRLLSLSVEAWEYTGGAHGNGGTGALLWDRAAKREIEMASLFSDARNMDRLLTQRWCNALNKAREAKRGEPGGGGGMFDDCPKLDDLAVIPADKTANGRFDTLLLVASPYVAGPYVEGSYEIALSVTPDLIATLKREYQPSFEPGIEP